MDLKQFRRVIHEIHGSHPQVSHFTICCISAFIGETVTYPLDSVKTRLQVAGELSVTKVRPRLFPLIVSTVKNEGIFSFWQGLSPALYRHFLYTGARMPIYEIIRNRVFDMPPASDKARHELEVARCKESQDSLSRSYVLHAAAGGIISGALAQFICSPTDLYKVRLQTEQRMNLVATTPVIDPTGRPIPSVASLLRRKQLVSIYEIELLVCYRRIERLAEVTLAVGDLHTSTSLRHSPKHRLAHSVTFRQLVKESGLLGLWRGGLPNVQRAALVNMGEMTTYDTAKRWLQRRFGLTDGPLLHGFASTMSGFVSACLGTPADFIKTRMMNQRVVTTSGVPLSPLYTGMIDCAIKVVKQEGFFTLYRGFFLIWGRMAPWSLTFWLTYEKMRAFIGVGGF